MYVYVYANNRVYVWVCLVRVRSVLRYLFFTIIDVDVGHILRCDDQVNAADDRLGKRDRQAHEQQDSEKADRSQHLKMTKKIECWIKTRRWINNVFGQFTSRSFVEIQQVEHWEEELVAGAHEKQKRLRKQNKSKQKHKV